MTPNPNNLADFEAAAIRFFGMIPVECGLQTTGDPDDPPYYNGITEYAGTLIFWTGSQEWEYEPVSLGSYGGRTLDYSRVGRTLESIREQLT